MSRRTPGWSQRFQVLVSQRLATPFTWAMHDCCLWAADCVLAQTEHDPAADLRGAYATEREALRLLARLGGLARVAAARLGPEILPAHAMRGDVGLCDQAGRPILGVCNGAHWLVPGTSGLVPVDRVHRAWSCEVAHG